MQLLQRHPGIRTYGEVFLPTDRPRRAATPELEPPLRYGDFRRAEGSWRPWTMRRYLTLLRTTEAGYNRVGCKVMYGHLLHNPDLLTSFIVDRTPVLHLIRHNVLDASISGHIADQSGRFHRHRDDPAGRDATYRIDVPAVVALIARRARQIRMMRRLLTLLRITVREISYEALQRDPDAELKKTVAFLGLDPQQLGKASRTPAGLQKIVVGRRDEVIENYAELRAALTGTPYESYL